MSPHEPVLPPPPPPALVPPRPDLAPPWEPPPARRRRRWPVVLAIVIAAAVAAAQLSVVFDAADVDRVEGQHAFLGRSPDGPYRWNPCQPILYEVNLKHAPPGAMQDVREAVARVSEATGIEFVEVGTTKRTVDMQMGRAFQSRVPGEERFLPLLIEWVPHEHFDFVADTHKAAAFGVPYRGFGELARTYVSGVIAMDAGEALPGGFGERYSRGVILMHELGHVMGLAHVASPDEIMWSPDVSKEPHPDLWQTQWGPGDLEGLAALGREAGCLPAR
jgi:hypothetical protein